ncbi:DUF2442 domain-containing protein [Chlorobium sp. N1]|uniref:DUF2442 domain-containing protein n=1 Tax=Chlorobium sp. N1 TaxID=2491138 RepID=UPI001040564A|nr:DUF2442 domain-containing protein [Chlorobium sp. N1]TCD48025.1 DUF2442 domain-containing protein [Chlorobium sp. N1]
MNILDIKANPDKTLTIIADNGCIGTFDLTPYLHHEAFEGINDTEEFLNVRNGGYYGEWDSGRDLSADTIEANRTITGKVPVSAYTA